MNTSLGYSFPKGARLRSRRDYQRIARDFGRKVGQWVIMDIRQGRPNGSRLGITISRKNGKAHERNRFKRLVREAFRHCQHELPPDLEINVRPSVKVTQVGYAQILEDLSQLTLLAQLV